MKMGIIRVLVMIGAMVFAAAACTETQETEQIVMRFPCDDTEAVIAEQGIELDNENQQEGSACFRIMPEEEKQVIPLFETGDIDAEDTFLVYEAYLKTRDVKEKAYLEMWCVFPERGEFFSRGLTRLYREHRIGLGLIPHSSLNKEKIRKMSG